MSYKKIAISLLATSLLISTQSFSESNFSENFSDADELKSTGEFNKRKNMDDLKASIPDIKLNIDYEVNAEMPEYISNLPVYGASNVNLNKLNTDKMASIFEFDLSNYKHQKKDDQIVSTMFTDKQQRSLEYFRSGAIFFSKSSLIPEDVGDLLEAKRFDKKSARLFYQEKASDFLKKNALYRDNMYFKDISFATLKTQNREQKTESSKIIAIAVNFGTTLEGVKTWGAGSKVTLYFNEKGMTGYYSALRNLEPIKEIKLIEPKQAVEKYTSYKSPKTLFRSATGIVRQVVIDQVELVYPLKSGNEDQKEITPHYLISGKFIGEDANNGKTIESDFSWLESAVAN